MRVLPRRRVLCDSSSSEAPFLDCGDHRPTIGRGKEPPLFFSADQFNSRWDIPHPPRAGAYSRGFASRAGASTNGVSNVKRALDARRMLGDLHRPEWPQFPACSCRRAACSGHRKRCGGVCWEPAPRRRAACLFGHSRGAPYTRSPAAVVFGGDVTYTGRMSFSWQHGHRIRGGMPLAFAKRSAALSRHGTCIGPAHDCGDI